MSRVRRWTFSISRSLVAFFAITILSLLMMFFVSPVGYSIIFLGIMVLSINITALVFLTIKNLGTAIVAGLTVFFLLSLRAVDQLDLVTLSILIAFVVILSISLSKKRIVEPSDE